MNFAVSLTGAAQVETAVVVATITTAGNASVIVTALCLPGGSRTLAVPVAELDDASAVALAIRTALAADEMIALFFTVSGAAENVVLTRNDAEANDSTLNIAIADGTCEGITPDATSNNTTPGTGTYDVQGEIHAVSQLILSNNADSTDNIYYGRPVVNATATAAAIVTGGTELDLTNVSGSIRQGMLVTGGSGLFTAGTKVLHVDGNKIILDQPCIGDDESVALTFIAILDSTTGVRVVPGEKVFMTPEAHRLYLTQGFRVLTAPGESATFRIQKLWN